MARGAGGLGRRAMDFFLPSACLACSSRIPPGATGAAGLVCATCRTRLRPVPSPICLRCGYPGGTGRAPGAPCLECRDWPPVLRSARCAVVLTGPAGRLVHALKYGGWRELAPLMAGRMTHALRTSPGVPAAAVVVPVPTTRARRRRRGYNQAALLARELALSTGRPLREALVREGDQRTQVALHPDERRANVQRAFSVRAEARPELREAHVVLVDDVLTTGATALAAAGALGSGGAHAVSVVAFARSLPHRTRLMDP